MKVVGWIVLVFATMAILTGCSSGARSDKPAKGSAAAESAQKGIPRSASDQSSKPPANPGN